MSGFGMAHRVVYGQAGLNKVQVVDERRDHKGTSGHLRILVILVMFLLLMMIASIIISVVSLSHWNRKDDGYDRYNGYNGYNSEYEKYRQYYHDNYGKDPPAPPSPYYPPKDEHVYTIAFGDDWGDHQMIDEDENCAHMGWGLKLVKAACEAAHLTCKTVYMPDKWCIDYFEKEDLEDHPVIGKGLLNSGITACGGWFPDPERYNLLKFSSGYIRNPEIFLWYRVGTTPPTTIATTTTIAFAYPSPWNEKCLRRYLERLPGATEDADLRPYGGEGSAKAALDANAVQLFFGSDLFDRTGYSKWSDSPMTCASGPAGLASNKKNKAFLEKFSKGLELIRGNGVMKEICENDDYHNPVNFDNWCVNTYWA